VSGTSQLFALLYDRLMAWESGSQFGSPGYYFLYWWFARWVADHSGIPEGTFFKSLVEEGTHRGMANLADKAGRTFAELLGDFTLATMVDDLAGFTPLSPVLTHPSWQSRNIFLALKNTAVSRTRDFPVVPTAAPFGNFGVDMSSIASGTARIFELTDANGTGSGTQLLRLRTLDGSSPGDPRIRMSVVRVQ
jgi:hypothetical protein